MAPLAVNRAASRMSTTRPRTGTIWAPRTTVYAQEPRFTLDNSKQAAEGFVEKDTAGQSNMYPTLMRPFEAGSAADTVQQDSFNNGLAVGSSVVALGAIALGLTALVKTDSSTLPAVVTEDVSSYLSLSAYSAKFSAQLAPPLSGVVVEMVEAPALDVEVVEAPALDVEVVAVAEPAP